MQIDGLILTPCQDIKRYLANFYFILRVNYRYDTSSQLNLDIQSQHPAREVADVR
jgi:hypothetical protein